MDSSSISFPSWDFLWNSNNLFKNALAFLLRGARHAIAWHTSTAHLCNPAGVISQPIYNNNLFSCKRSKKTLCILFILSDKRKSTTSAHVVLFLFGMSLRGFPRCIAVCYYIQSWGMLLWRGSIYINWSLPSQDCSWGKQSATA